MENEQQSSRQETDQERIIREAVVEEIRRNIAGIQDSLRKSIHQSESQERINKEFFNRNTEILNQLGRIESRLASLERIRDDVYLIEQERRNEIVRRMNHGEGPCCNQSPIGSVGTMGKGF